MRIRTVLAGLILLSGGVVYSQSSFEVTYNSASGSVRMPDDGAQFIADPEICLAKVSYQGEGDVDVTVTNTGNTSLQITAALALLLDEGILAVKSETFGVAINDSTNISVGPLEALILNRLTPIGEHAAKIAVSVVPHGTNPDFSNVLDSHSLTVIPPTQKGGSCSILPAETFIDDFESGDTSMWSDTIGLPSGETSILMSIE